MYMLIIIFVVNFCSYLNVAILLGKKFLYKRAKISFLMKKKMYIYIFFFSHWFNKKIKLKY